MTQVPSNPQPRHNALGVEEFIRSSIGRAADLWSRQGGTEAYIELGRVRIRLRMMGAAMPDLILPALQHAVADPAPAGEDAVLYAIDSEAADFETPPAVWPFTDETREAQMRTHWNGGKGPVLSSDESRGIWHLHDMENGCGLYWLRSCRALPSWEAGSPLRHHIHWISHAAGQEMLHAAVVSNGHGGAMLTGPGGSGKSTMTAAALRNGWQVTGDDFVLVERDPVAASYCLYDLIKLTGMAENLFAEHSGNAINPARATDEKLMARISGAGAGQFVAKLPLDAVFSLKLSGEETSRIEPASHFEVLRAIAPNTSTILRTGLRETFAFAGALVRDLPCHVFHVGRDPLEALRLLDGFMRELPR